MSGRVVVPLGESSRIASRCEWVCRLGQIGAVSTACVNLSEAVYGWQALNRFLRKLQRIADEHGVAVVITNQAGCQREDAGAKPNSASVASRQVMASPESGPAAYMGPQAGTGGFLTPSLE